MSIREDLKALVQLQKRELELLRIDEKIAAIGARRTELEERVAAAEAVVKQAEKDAEGARAEAKRLDLDLKSAEEKVSKYKDQMHNVKTNEQLWALQEEIGHAEQEVSAVEDKILQQLETAENLDEEIGRRKGEMAAEKKRIDAEVAEANADEAKLETNRAEVEAAIATVTEQVPADLLKKYQGIKSMRGGIGVAEVLDETCLVCNTKVRPQHYVNTLNFSDVMQCENCKRIIFVADSLGLNDPPPPPAEAAANSTADLAS